MAKQNYPVDFSRIEQTMMEIGIPSYLALCRKTRLAQSYLSRSKKTGKLGMEALFRISEALKKPVKYFLIDEKISTSANPKNQLSASLTAPIPLLDKMPAQFPQINSPKEIVEYISLPGVPSQAFAFKINDDAMEPAIKKHDIVFFFPNENLNTDDLAVISNDRGEISLRRYQEKSGKISLSCDNPAFPSPTPKENFKILGKAIESWRKIRL